MEGDAVALAVADPLDTTALDHARMLLRRERQRRSVAARLDHRRRHQQRLRPRRSTRPSSWSTRWRRRTSTPLAHELEEPQDLLDTDDEAPIIRLVNSLLFRAAKERASDIHIEPMERELLVRFRIDGVLQEIIKPPKRFQNSIVSRVKIMGQLNIAEKRLPQDGRIRIKLAGRDIDIRVSTIPTTHGERIVMRLLDKSATLLDLADLGMSAGHARRRWTRSSAARTASSWSPAPPAPARRRRSTARSRRINTPDLNILTVEDPVEYQLKGIGQMPVNPKIGLTFASGLRAFLRQDPDVIMVGEIRDKETAEIAIQASLTGHLVFSTVHTNDAAGAITRLVDMGVEPFLVASLAHRRCWRSAWCAASARTAA